MSDALASRRTARLQAAPPLFAFALARLVGAAVALRAGFSPLRVSSWIRWDSFWYLRLAQHGYQLERCRDEPSNLCGGTGWLPGYPVLIRLLAGTGAPPEAAAVAIAAAAHLLLLVFLWCGFLKALPGGRKFLALALAAFFPGAIYLQAVFPVSLALLFALLFLHEALEDRYARAAAFGAAAAFTYATGFLLGVAYALWLLSCGEDRQRDWRRLLPVAGPLLGFGAVNALMAAQTGVWGAFFKTQAGYGYGLSNPLTTLLSRLAGGEAPAGLQTLLVAALAAAAGWVALRGRARPRLSLFGCAVAVYWLFPLLLGGGISLYRSDAMLLPSTVLLAEAPPALLAALAVCAVLLTPSMELAFFRGVLV